MQLANNHDWQYVSNPCFVAGRHIRRQSSSWRARLCMHAGGGGGGGGRKAPKILNSPLFENGIEPQASKQRVGLGREGNQNPS